MLRKSINPDSEETKSKFRTFKSQNHANSNSQNSKNNKRWITTFHLKQKIDSQKTQLDKLFKTKKNTTRQILKNEKKANSRLPNSQIRYFKFSKSRNVKHSITTHHNHSIHANPTFENLDIPCRILNLKSAQPHTALSLHVYAVLLNTSGASPGFVPNPGTFWKPTAKMKTFGDIKCYGKILPNPNFP